MFTDKDLKRLIEKAKKITIKRLVKDFNNGIEMQLLKIYNRETYFQIRLNQIPNTIKIKVINELIEEEIDNEDANQDYLIFLCELKQQEIIKNNIQDF